MYIYMYVCMYVCVSVCMSVYLYVCMYIYMFILYIDSDKLGGAAAAAVFRVLARYSSFQGALSY